MTKFVVLADDNLENPGITFEIWVCDIFEEANILKRSYERAHREYLDECASYGVKSLPLVDGVQFYHNLRIVETKDYD